MIGKIIGGLVGAQASKKVSSIGGTGGAILGAVAVPVIARMRLPTLLLLGAGGYLAKKLIDKNEEASGPGSAAADTGNSTGTP